MDARVFLKVTSVSGVISLFDTGRLFSESVKGEDLSVLSEELAGMDNFSIRQEGDDNWLKIDLSTAIDVQLQVNDHANNGEH